MMRRSLCLDSSRFETASRFEMAWVSTATGPSPSKRMVKVSFPPTPTSDPEFIFYLSTVSINLLAQQRPASIPYIVCMYVCAWFFRHISSLLFAVRGESTLRVYASLHVNVEGAVLVRRGELATEVF